MKLVIQIPCRDESATLAATIAALPRVIAGIDEIQVVDIAGRPLGLIDVQELVALKVIEG